MVLSWIAACGLLPQLKTFTDTQMHTYTSFCNYLCIQTQKYEGGMWIGVNMHNASARSNIILVWIEMLMHFQPCLGAQQSVQHTSSACMSQSLFPERSLLFRLLFCKTRKGNKYILYRRFCNIKHETSPDVFFYLGKYTQFNGTPVPADKSNASTVSIELILTVSSQAYWSSRWPRSICLISVLTCSGCLYGNRWW